MNVTPRTLNLTGVLNIMLEKKNLKYRSLYLKKKPLTSDCMSLSKNFMYVCMYPHNYINLK